MNQTRFQQHAGPGHWNDPDMLLIGNFGLTVEQSKHQMAVWAILAAPLLMSTDLKNIRPEFRDILLNRHVIEVNQDRLGIQGLRIRNERKIEVCLIVSIISTCKLMMMIIKGLIVKILIIEFINHHIDMVASHHSNCEWFAFVCYCMDVATRWRCTIFHRYTFVRFGINTSTRIQSDCKWMTHLVWKYVILKNNSRAVNLLAIFTWIYIGSFRWKP